MTNAITTWNEIPGRIATSNDPHFGGIIDQTIKTGEWFVIFNADIAPLDGFKSREEAFAAHEAAIRNHFWVA